MIVVFGCAGLRDRAKRRLMGNEAAGWADLTVITAEDPRTEALADIMAETAQALAAAGRVEGRDFVRIADRQRAILHAVQQAGPGDVVLVCGKGHEQSMCFGAVEHPWRDQDALRWALDRRQGRAVAEPPYVLPTWGGDTRRLKSRTFAKSTCVDWEAHVDLTSRVCRVELTRSSVNSHYEALSEE